jgi:hypothetical protein
MDKKQDACKSERELLPEVVQPEKNLPSGRSWSNHSHLYLMSGAPLMRHALDEKQKKCIVDLLSSIIGSPTKRHDIVSFLITILPPPLPQYADRCDIIAGPRVIEDPKFSTDRNADYSKTST